MTEVDIKKSLLVKKVSTIKKLLLDCSKHKNTNVQFDVSASKFFTRFINLTKLNISGIGICKEVADTLAEAIGSRLLYLECLIMNNCHLTLAKILNIIEKH